MMYFFSLRLLRLKSPTLKANRIKQEGLSLLGHQPHVDINQFAAEAVRSWFLRVAPPVCTTLLALHAAANSAWQQTEKQVEV